LECWSIGKHQQTPTSWVTSSYALKGLTDCNRKALMATNIVSENIQYSITPTLHFSDSSLPAEPIISDPRRRVFILTPKTWSSLRAVGPIPNVPEAGQVSPPADCQNKRPWDNGIMENWNAVFYGKEIDFYMDSADQKLIRLRRTAFHTQYSITPAFHYSIGYRTVSNTHLG